MTRKLFFWGRAGALVASTLAFVGCLKAPDYPVEPTIAFDTITLRSFPNPPSPRVDSVRVTVSFQDGDGDLGLGGRLGVPADAEYPYAFQNNDGTPNRYNSNYFIEPYRKNRSTGVFEKLPISVIPAGEYNGRFPRLTAADTKPAPLKGTISRDFSFALGAPFIPGDEVRFEVIIADRALHESNTITTSSIIIPPR